MMISIITVCRNSSKTIERALRSVVEQDYPNIDHIVIDGASTDSTLSILQNFRAHLSHLISEPDDGIYDAMNKGLALARGDVICFLNADDFYSSSKVISSVMSQIQLYKLDALIGNVAYFKEKNPNKIIRLYRSSRFTPKRLSWGLMPAHPALFLKKNIFNRVGLFDKSYRIAGDFEFVIRVFHNQSICYQYDQNILVNMQSGGISNNGWKSKYIINCEILRACRKNGLASNQWKILFRYIYKFADYIFK